MANKRIKDLSTTAAVTASDDFIAVDGATNGTRKLDAYNPTFGGNLTVSGGTIGTAASTNLTLQGGSSGASLVLGQGATGQAVLRSQGGSAVRLYGSDGGSGTQIADFYNGGSTVAAVLGDGQVSTPGVSGRGGSGVYLRSNASGNPIIFQATSGIEWARLSATNGNLLVGTTTDSGNGKLQLATHTTSAGGIGFGTDWTLSRDDATNFALYATGGASATFALYLGGVKRSSIGTDGTTTYIGSRGVGYSTILMSGNGTTAVTLDTSQRCILAGALRLNNAYTAGAPTATGYVTIQDSAGNTYKVLVGT